MFQNYLKLALRNLSRNRLYTLLNILGMGVGITLMIWGYQVYRFSFSMDDFHADKEHLFRAVVTREGSDELKGVCPLPVAQLAQRDFAGITESVAAHRLHCGLIRVPVARPPGLEFEALLREPVVVALPRDHALAQRKPGRRAGPVALADLRDDGFILVRRPGAPGLYANLLALCEEQGIQPTIAAEVGRMGTSLNLVAAGAGVSVVPASMQGQHSQAVVYLPLLESARLDAPLTLVYRSADTGGPVAHFLAIARKTAARLARRGAA